jgi:hypothetical protein
MSQTPTEVTHILYMVIIFAARRFRVPRSFSPINRQAPTFQAQPVPKPCRNLSSPHSDKIGHFYSGNPRLCSKDVLRFRPHLLPIPIYMLALL